MTKWKLYIAGNAESGYQCLLRTGIETIPLAMFPTITDKDVTMLGIDNKLYVISPEKVEIIRGEIILPKLKKYKWPQKPSEASIAFAALIADLNHNSGYFPMDFTPFDQRFSFETHKQMGGRKLNHDRD